MRAMDAGQWIPCNPVVTHRRQTSRSAAPSRSWSDCSAVDSQPIDISRIRHHFAATNHPPTVIATVSTARGPSASPLDSKRTAAMAHGVPARVQQKRCVELRQSGCLPSRSALLGRRMLCIPISSLQRLLRCALWPLSRVPGAALTHRSLTRTCLTSRRCTRSGRLSSASCARTRASPQRSPSHFRFLRRCDLKDDRDFVF